MNTIAQGRERRITIEQIGLKWGLMLAGANIGFFLLMALFGLEHVSWLRFVNLIFIFLFAYRGMQYFKHHTQSYWTYFKGLALGNLIVLAGALVFCAFLLAYSLLKPEFIAALKMNQPVLGDNFNPFVIAALAFIEMIIYGFILVFAGMQRLKTSFMKDSVHNY